MRTSLAALLALSLAGCISFTEVDPILARAARGEAWAVVEAGELGRPRVPSSARPLPLLEKAFDAVRANCDSEDPFLRQLAVDSLRHLCERAPDIYRSRCPTALDRPLEDVVPSIRWRAAWALGRIGETRPRLRERAARDPDDPVAAMCCWALGRARDDGALRELAVALDRAPPVRAAALEALSRITTQRLGDDVAAWKKFCLTEAERLDQVARERARLEAERARALEAAHVASPTTAPIGSPTAAPIASPTPTGR